MSEKPKQPDDFLELLKKWRNIQNPGLYHEIFQTMVGEWNVELIFYGGGHAWKSQCKAKNELLHGGRFFLETVEGLIYAPDESGSMREEAYSSTRMLGYDNYKKAYSGTFVENQNSYMLSFTGRKPLRGEKEQIDFYGLQDEPMLEINDTTMKYTLEIVDDSCYIWKVYALALGDNSLVFEFTFRK